MQWIFFHLLFCRRFTGIEFAVVHVQPPGFFIIQKRERLSPDESVFAFTVISDKCFHSCFKITARPLAVYFIMNSRIYQSPDLYTVVSNRLVRSFMF